MPPPRSGGGGGADEYFSRIAFFGGLVMIAVFVLGAAVAIGLGEGDDSVAAPISTTQTAPRTTIVGEPPPPPPVAAEPASEPELETTPQAAAIPGANECRDAIDNDNDDLVDGEQDDGCLLNDTEAPGNLPGSADDGEESSAPSECNDKFDNDSDGFLDGEDPSCPSETESPPDDEP